MREYKFRAWDKSAEIMLCMEDFQESELEDIIFQRAYSYILMQYTSLKDKNGREIYEGDMVKLGHYPTEEEPEGLTAIAEVIFSKGQFWCTYYGFPVYSWACSKKSFIEVIGNIYENPELLEREKNV